MERTRKRNHNKNKLYKVSRQLHFYLSAVAFLLLLFFAFSGLLLNHPEWLQGERVKQETTIQINNILLQQIKESKRPDVLLSEIIKDSVDVPGVVSRFIDLGDGYQMEFRGLGGSASLFVDSETGHVDISVKRATLVDKIHVLHKGKNTGQLWSILLDFTAIMTLILSIFGFVLLFTVKKRRTLTLQMIGLSTVVVSGVIIFGVA